MLRAISACTILILLALFFAPSLYSESFVWDSVTGVGGTSQDSGYSMAVDNAGNRYITGVFVGSVSFGSITLTGSSSSLNGFIAKYNSNNNWDWAVRVGNSGNIVCNSICISNNSYLYVIGEFSGTVAIGTTNLTSSGSYDVFIAKMDLSGVWQWAKKGGGTGREYGKGIASNSAGDVFVTGLFSGTATIGSTITSSGGLDVFVSKLTSTGTWSWSKRAGGTSDEDVLGIAIDSNNQSYLIGKFSGTATIGSYMVAYGGTDIFVASINSSGTWNWGKKAGGTSSDSGLAITTAGETLFVSGYFFSTAHFGDLIRTIPGGSCGVFVASMTFSGSFSGVSTASSTIIMQGLGLYANVVGQVYLTGSYSGTATIGSFTLANSSSSSSDMFVAVLDADGTWAFAQKGGGSGTDIGYSIYQDVGDNIHVTGEFASTAQYGDLNLTSAGNSDIIVGKLRPLLNPASLVLPADAATNVPINTSLEWSAPAVGIPEGYRIYLGTDNPPTNLENGTDLGNVLTYTPSASFSHLTQYYWKIVPYSGSEQALDCPVWSFTTIIEAPGPAGASAPPDYGTNVPIGASLNWTVPAGGGLPTGYKLYFDTANPPVTYIGDLGNVLTYNPSPDMANITTYYWKVVPYNVGGDAASCPVWDFTTVDILPLPATLVSPPNNAPNVSVSQTLSWTPAAGSGAPTGYLLYLGNNYPPTNIYNGVSIGNVTSFTPGSPLPYNTGIYWKIVPVNGAGEATGCATWSFTTEMSTRYTVDPLVWNFNSVNVGDEVRKAVTITNTGVDMLDINQLRRITGSTDYYLSGLPADFPATAIHIPPGQTLVFDIVYCPSATGHTTAMFRIETNAISSYINVEGTGAQGVLPWFCDFTGVADGYLPAGWTTQNGDNWFVYHYDAAGGEAPELLLYSEPPNINTPRAVTPLLTPTPGTSYLLTFRHYVDWYVTWPSSFLMVESSTDGVNWDVEWEIQPTGDIDPAIVSINISHLAAAPFYLAFSLSGSTYDVDGWCIDDIRISVFEHVVPSAPILKSPAQDEFFLVGNNPDLKWDPPVTGFPDWYRVFIANTPANIVQYYVPSSTTVFSTALIPPEDGIDFSEGSTVHWVVEAIDSAVPEGTQSEGRWFTFFDIERDIDAYCEVAADIVTPSNKGLSTFNLQDPGTITRLAAPSYPTSDYISGGAWINGVWYAFQSGENKLWRVDPVTGAMTLVGSTGMAFTALTYNSVFDILYASYYDSSSNTSSLYTIDYHTAVPTLQAQWARIGFMLIGLAWDPWEDVLYALDIGTDALWWISQVSWTAYQIGSLGIDLNFAQDMAFDPDFGNLFLAGYKAGSGGNLYMLDIFTGGAYLMGSLQNTAEVDGLVIPGVQFLPAPQPVVDIDTDISISWLSVPKATYYTLYGDTDPAGQFSSELACTIDTSWQMPTTDPNQFFRVIAHRGPMPSRGRTNLHLSPKPKVTSGSSSVLPGKDDLIKKSRK